MHPAGADLDEEQDMEPAECRGVDAREVGRDDAFRLGADELRPGGSGPFGGRVDSRGPQDRPHRRRGDRIADTAQFALYAPIPSLWVLDGGTDRESADLGQGRWPSAWVLVWVGPSVGRRGDDASRSRLLAAQST